jgi:hypothetical protein
MQFVVVRGSLTFCYALSEREELDKYMPVLAFLQANAVSDALNNTEWAFPMAECFHIVFFGVAIGTIMVVDLRLLGLAFSRHSPAKLAQDTALWTLAGFAITILAGMTLFLSDPRMYSFNMGFRFKVGALLVALVFHYTVHAKVVSSEARGAYAVVGVISVLLWITVVFSGIFIAFI